MVFSRKFIISFLAAISLFLLLRFLLPLLLPFLVGGALALAAEPIASFCSRRLRLPRPLASGISVALAFSLLTLCVILLLGLLLRELRLLAGILPELEGTMRSGMDALSRWLLELTSKAPDSIRPLLARNVSNFFSSGSALLDRATEWLLGLASTLLTSMPDRFLSVGTAILSSFMISAKLPKFRGFWESRDLRSRLAPVVDTFRRIKTALLGWLRAQLRLSTVTFLLAAVGLLLLRIPYAPLWALLVALVDALPILGSGTALVPWSLVCFLQGDRFRAFGLLLLYGTAALTRTLLEPRLVGRQLGLDPLVTLLSLYIGYRLWGFAGMLLAPAMAVAVMQLPLPGADPPDRNLQ